MVAKILGENDFLDENADFRYLSLFLACFLPVMAPVSLSKDLNEFIRSGFDSI